MIVTYYLFIYACVYTYIYICEITEIIAKNTCYSQAKHSDTHAHQDSEKAACPKHARSEDSDVEKDSDVGLVQWVSRQDLFL